jgi:osmotically-inducible protein OsmY
LDEGISGKLISGIGGSFRRNTHIETKIENKTAYTAKLEGAKVNVTVENGSVILHGTVVLYIQKMLYEQIAWRTAGVVEVDNAIRVVPQLPQTDPAIERKIIELMQSHPRWQGNGLEAVVKEGAVIIRGTFEHQRDVLSLKQRVADVEGVVALDLQANFRN